MNEFISHTEGEENPAEETPQYDYAFVSAVARIALYDDLLSAPRVTEILPAETGVYIENLASKVYELAKESGGSIPYTVIREVSENFIHAKFKEIIVSILDNGNTIRFADQGPGINHKERAQLPGFSSAIEPMKKYIRGVGSGLPIVREYLEFSHGTISIEDNMGAGSVVTISLGRAEEQRAETSGASAEEVFTDALAQEPFATTSGVGNSQNAQTAGQSVSHGAQMGAGANPFAGQAFSEQPGAGAAQPQYSMNPNQGFQNAQPLPQPIQPNSYQQMPEQGFVDPLYASQFTGNQPMPTQGGYAYPTHPMNQPGYNGFMRDPATAAYYASHGASRIQMAVAPLSQRERDFLPILLHEGPLGVTDISRLTDIAGSSTYVVLRKLEEAGLVEKTAGQKRELTPLGREVAQSLL